MNVLVTDGSNRASLAIVRSLGRKGHAILVGEKCQPSLASVSRYCTRTWSYPDPFTRPEDFVEDVQRVVTEKGIDLLLPVTEITTSLITENARRFEGLCRLPFPDSETFRKASNKAPGPSVSHQ